MRSPRVLDGHFPHARLPSNALQPNATVTLVEGRTTEIWLISVLGLHHS